MGPDNGMKFFTSREISSSSRPHLSSRLSQLSRETFLTALAALAGLTSLSSRWGDPQRAHSYSLYTVVYLISVQYYTKSFSISLQTLSHDTHNIYTCTTCTTCSCTTCSCTTCTLVLLLHILHIHMLVHLHSYGTCILYIHSHCIYSHCIHCSWITLCFCINNKYCNLLYN